MLPSSNVKVRAHTTAYMARCTKKGDALTIQFPTPIRIQTNDVELEVFARGSGRPVVLCHGWPEHAFSWRHQIEPLAGAGYHVIAPNQRGYGYSDRPAEVNNYDIHHLTADLVGLLDHYGYQDAVFVGHDWGAIVVWNLAMLHPERVCGVINLSVPFMNRGETEWVSNWEKMGGDDFYIVHFNRQPGVADAAFAESPRRFLGNLYRTDHWLDPQPDPQPGMALINLATVNKPRGKPLMSDEELDVFVTAYEHSGFTGGINWYRNFTRNWQTTAEVEQVVRQPALMIHGQHDIGGDSDQLRKSVPNVEIHTLDCGHWIQQERPQATNELILDWLAKYYPA
jgi:pimeloyl-ACP methyl ester carboxylesterase